MANLKVTRVGPRTPITVSGPELAERFIDFRGPRLPVVKKTKQDFPINPVTDEPLPRRRKPDYAANDVPVVKALLGRASFRRPMTGGLRKLMSDASVSKQAPRPELPPRSQQMSRPRIVRNLRKSGTEF